jgi:anti-anti-sigma factor
MDTHIDIEKEEIDWIMIFKFSWELDETNADKTFRSIYAQIWDFDKKKVIFNFAKLKYMNSKSTWYIALYYSHIDEFGWKMYICECWPRISNILDAVWITSVTKIIETQDEALEIAKNEKL